MLFASLQTIHEMSGYKTRIIVMHVLAKLLDKSICFAVDQTNG